MQSKGTDIVNKETDVRNKETNIRSKETDVRKWKKQAKNKENDLKRHFIMLAPKYRLTAKQNIEKVCCLLKGFY